MYWDDYCDRSGRLRMIQPTTGSRSKIAIEILRIYCDHRDIWLVVRAQEDAKEIAIPWSELLLP